MINNYSSEERIEKLRKLMSDRDIDILLVCKNENKIYLSGFSSSNFYLIITKERQYLLTDFRYIEAASMKAKAFKVVRLTADNTVFKFLSSLNGRKVGTEFETINVNFYNNLQSSCDDSELVNSDGLIESLRIVKDENELNCIRKAAEIADKGFAYILNYIVPGAVERELAFKLEVFMRENGASGLSFDTIMISGSKTSLPHGEPDDKAVETGDFVTMDFGCVYNGYCSDMTRTVAAGKISDEQKHVYDIVLEAQESACARIKAGMKAADADALARDIIESAGYGDYFGHSLGHGVGLEIHEAPTLSPTNTALIKENTIVTIEPGIYIPSSFGVRIEDMVIVRDYGIENLCKSPKQLIFTC